MSLPMRDDFKEILRLVRPGSRVLDVGALDGGTTGLAPGPVGIDALLDLVARP